MCKRDFRSSSESGKKDDKAFQTDKNMLKGINDNVSFAMTSLNSKNMLKFLIIFYILNINAIYLCQKLQYLNFCIKCIYVT